MPSVPRIFKLLNLNLCGNQLNSITDPAHREREREEIRKSSFSNPISGHWEVPFGKEKHNIKSYMGGRIAGEEITHKIIKRKNGKQK